MFGRLLLILLIGLLIPLSGYGQDIPPVQRGENGVPDASWPSIYFQSFDQIVLSRGLQPLRASQVPDHTTEIRVWIGGGHGYPQHFYRLVQTPDSLKGAMFFHWPVHFDSDPQGETTQDSMYYNQSGRCDSFAYYERKGSCQAVFQTEPDWGLLFEQTKELGLLTLPDASELPQPAGITISVDGTSLIVEIATETEYRTYKQYLRTTNPTWPEQEVATEIARLFIALHHLTRKPDNWGIHRGITSGEYKSGFRLCDSDEVWEQYFPLEVFVERAELTMPEPGPYGYLVELGGIPSPKSLAQRWNSEFDRIMQIPEIRSIAPAMNPECE